MYTATMKYFFKKESFEDACILWEKHVIKAAQAEKGFVRMQFLTANPQAMAIGTWESQTDARRFMETGVFKNLMQELESMIDAKPEPQIWDLLYFAES